MKKFLCTFLALCIALSVLLCGCSSTPGNDDNQGGDQPPVSENEKVIPWGAEGSIIQQAKDTKSMVICFMSGEGTEIKSSATTAFSETKWGDSTLIAFPNGETMLIDGGMSDYAPLLVENLQSLGVEKLDYVVISHGHNDHNGGLLCSRGVLESFPVGKIYYSGIYNSSASNPAKIDSMAKENGAELIALAKGDVLQFGDVTMEALWPLPGLEGTFTNSTEDCNSSSLVLRFDYGATSALFVGDLYKGGELEMIKALGDDVGKLDVDVLKIPHHGRSTSSSNDFITAVTPDVAVALGAIIMETSVYSSYARTGTAVYMDVYDGYVKTVLDGTDVTTECSRVRDVEVFDKFDTAFGIVRD